MFSETTTAVGLLAAACWWCCWLVVTPVRAQFPPQPEGVTVVRSKFHENISISYKEPGICETTPGVRSYSGYVNLPPGTLVEKGESQQYPVHTFFWFFESRKDPHNAPLSIWLNGGPGGSSLIGALAENGPCMVNRDSNSTYLNPWSWNNEVNMLYIDQPNQVGFSYDVPTNCTVDVLGGFNSIQVADFSNGVPNQNSTFFVGTMASQNLTHTANSTNHSAIALWHFAQTWFEEFPQYKPHDERISLWTESYGGHYGPAIFNFFQHQNERITDGTLKGPGTHYLHLDTLGVVNGCTDDLHQASSWADYPWNNTYGIKAINDTQYHKEKYELERPGGVLDGIRECQRLARLGDPAGYGTNATVNEACSRSGQATSLALLDDYQVRGNHGWFDLTHPRADPFPPSYLMGFLNQQWVQKSLGVPVNFTAASFAVGFGFGTSGDMPRGGTLEEYAYILDSGIKVALMYGDRDFCCNWVGGEIISKKIPYSGQLSFLEAGYEPITVSPFYSGGSTRQYGNLSFSRVYQAGHMVPAYQPETSWEIFTRALFNKDIATGTIQVSDDYKTQGPDSVWHIKNDVLPSPEPECYVLNVGMMSCSDEHKSWLADGTAIVEDYFIVGREERKQEVVEAEVELANDQQAPLGSDRQ